MQRAVRAEELGPADVIIANNVLAHIPDPNDFVAGIAHLLADDGIVTVENPSVWDLVERCAFDTIYHEHFFYHSCTSIKNLVERNGLHLNHVEYFPDLHGGTNRWHLAHASDPSGHLVARLAAERDAGLDRLRVLRGVRQEGRRVAGELRDLLQRLRDEGRSVAAYGAAAKGATLLNATGISTDLVSYVVDRNTHKHGRFMPGTHQPIVGVERLIEDPPDVLLLLAWNFAAEIMQQQSDYAARGGRFLIPVPRPEIV
jgi:SAM-dependent methyltransferase